MNFKMMEKALLYQGSDVIRRKGSHVIYCHHDGRMTTVPNHHGMDLARPLVSEILGSLL